MDSVYADGTYDTKRCSQLIADRQAHPVIPPRKNGQAIIGEVWSKLRCIASNY